MSTIKFPRLLSLNMTDYSFDDIIFFLGCVRKFPINSDRIVLLGKTDFIRNTSMDFNFIYRIHNHIVIDYDKYISVFDSLDVCRLPSGKIFARVVLSNDFCSIINSIITEGYGKLDPVVLRYIYKSRRRSCLSLYLMVCWVFGESSRVISIDDLRFLYKYKATAEVMRHFKADLDDLSFVLKAKDLGGYAYAVIKDGKTIKGVSISKLKNY